MFSKYLPVTSTRFPCIYLNVLTCNPFQHYFSGWRRGLLPHDRCRRMTSVAPAVISSPVYTGTKTITLATIDIVLQVYGCKITGLRANALRHQLFCDIHGSLELRLVFIGGLHGAESSTSLRADIAPLQIVATPHDTDAQSIDVLATYRVFRWDGLEDRLEFLDKRINRSIFWHTGLSEIGGG